MTDEEVRTWRIACTNCRQVFSVVLTEEEWTAYLLGEVSCNASCPKCGSNHHVSVRKGVGDLSHVKKRQV